MNELSERRFRRFGIFTIASVFFLILVGGLVRSTGSGMGCPDWPKCFGQWIPPTDISELPLDYKEKFSVQGHAIADFDVFKTWVEYVNRLIGVLTGLFIFLTLFFAIPYLKKDKTVFWLSFLAFILVGFQGWIGAKVVSSNLAHWMVTIHMLVALVIVALLIYTITRSQDFKLNQLTFEPTIKPLLVLLILISMIQTIAGTQVREAIDIIAIQTGENQRINWIDILMNQQTPLSKELAGYRLTFMFHRTFSLISLVFTIMMVVKIRKVFERNSIIYKSALAILLLIAIQIFSGKVLDTLGMPRYVQSLHLFVGSLISGGYLYITIMLFTKTTIYKTEAK